MTFDCADPHAQASFWALVLGIETALLPARARNEGREDRVHLDIQVDPDQKQAELERLQALGSQPIETRSDRGPLTHVRQDPEGNEFCLH